MIIVDIDILVMYSIVCRIVCKEMSKITFVCFNWVCLNLEVLKQVVNFSTSVFLQEFVCPWSRIWIFSWFQNREKCILTFLF